MELAKYGRILRGAIGNAIVWGTVWTASAFVVFQGLLLSGALEDSMRWYDGLLVGARFGLMGGITGGAFAAYIGLRYHGRTLSEINWIRFGVGGGVLAGLFVPGFMNAVRLLSGDGVLSVTDILRTGLLSAAFGGIAAAVSMKLAQRAANVDNAAPDQLGAGSAFDAASEWAEGVQKPKSRVGHH